VYSCFGIFFTSRPSSLDANHRPLEDEKRRVAQLATQQLAHLLGAGQASQIAEQRCLAYSALVVEEGD
jgi:hypothetical protein